MRLFRRKKKGSEPQETTIEVYGGAIVTKLERGYEMTWRSPNLTSIRLTSPPVIEEGIQVTHEGENMRIDSPQFKLKIVTGEGQVKAFISKI
ncbi:hypothetical protein DRO55_01415 [Candidatus Bathyarchaeota archaeon]|nr:MAG: hypothetical protein DRO55_01415 [Candidatus Bathyarchaeota archaeon]